MQENDPMCPVLLIPLCSETTARIIVVRGQERKENVFGTGSNMKKIVQVSLNLAVWSICSKK